MAYNASNLKWIDITKFNENALIDLGLPFTNRFACFLNYGGFKGANSDRFTWHTISADIPGFTVVTKDMELFGQRRFSFTKREDSDIGVTFLDNSRLDMRKIFFEWMEKAISITNTGIHRQYPDSASQGGKLQIAPLGNEGDAQFCDTFVDVLPFDISGITYNYADMEVIKTTVKFKYSGHYIEQIY